MEKGSILNKEWLDDKKELNSKINDCIFIEKNISNINEIKSEIEKCNSIKMDIQFLPNNDDIKVFLDEIKKFGGVFDLNTLDYKFRFSPGPNYEVTNNGLVAIKNNGGDAFNCTIIGNKEIPKNKISKWKIKLNSNTKQSWDILIGIGPNNQNNEINFYNKC